jgi:transcriptional regulator with XRE-family HTH domain
MTAPLDHYKSLAEAFAARCGARVRAGRLNADFTQADLAAATYSPNPASVSHWETGRFMPSVMRQFAIADALLVPMSVLWGHGAGHEQELEEILHGRGAPPAVPATAAAGSNVRLAAFGAHYVSIECQHDKHGRACERVCPECDAPCRCWCHLTQAVTSAPVSHGTDYHAPTPVVEAVNAGQRARERAASALDAERWGA